MNQHRGASPRAAWLIPTIGVATTVIVTVTEGPWWGLATAAAYAAGLPVGVFLAALVRQRRNEASRG